MILVRHRGEPAPTPVLQPVVGAKQRLKFHQRRVAQRAFWFGQEGILAAAAEFAKMSRKMKLPNVERAVVPGRKITHYLLSTAHRDGRQKQNSFAV